jgi:A/G-specific adenine glycosylase
VPDLTRRLIAIGCANFGMYAWQQAQDPYVVFVAEYFLRRSNRTTVQRFLPRFLERFPDAASLAKTEPEVVAEVACWAGMRTRTMNLPTAVAAFASLARPTVPALEQISHVGPYAARAIALYAFGQPVFPVDGNATRVLTRFLNLSDTEQVGLAANAVVDAARKFGSHDAVKYAHSGALTVGWVACRVQRRCGVCPLVSGCGSALAVEPSGGRI